MSQDGKEVATLKYKSTSNCFATEHPGLREERITCKVSSQTTDPFSTAKAITRKLPKITKVHILILNRYAQHQWEFLYRGKQRPYGGFYISKTVQNQSQRKTSVKWSQCKRPRLCNFMTSTGEESDYIPEWFKAKNSPKDRSQGQRDMWWSYWVSVRNWDISRDKAGLCNVQHWNNPRFPSKVAAAAERKTFPSLCAGVFHGPLSDFA